MKLDLHVQQETHVSLKAQARAECGSCLTVSGTGLGERNRKQT